MKKRNLQLILTSCAASLLIFGCSSYNTSNNNFYDSINSQNAEDDTKLTSEQTTEKESTTKKGNSSKKTTSSKKETDKTKDTEENTTKVNKTESTEETTSKNEEETTEKSTSSSSNQSNINADDKTLQKYIKLLEPADDDIDFMFASDYYDGSLLDFYTGTDACSYGILLDIDKKITVEDIEDVLKTNNKIADKYKEFIIQYAKDWLSLYPESDLRVLYHNLKTLEIKEATPNEIYKITFSYDTAACYIPKENTIMLLDGTSFERDSDNYIILTHELTHCARQTKYVAPDSSEITIKYYERLEMGEYAEEGIITNIAYEMQGLNKKATFYAFQSSCYRIIMDCIGFDGEDYMNHSVNYLIKKMDEFMGDDQYAYYIVALIDAQATQRYSPHRSVDFTNYQDLYDYITRMYMKKHLTSNMSKAEAEEVFETFCDEIMYHFDNMKTKYDITEDNFRQEFEKILKERGIS